MPVLDCDTMDMLKVAVELWRLQTVQPYFLIIDTGSPWAVCEQLEAMRGPDCEVHYVRGNGYIHSSAPVSLGMDLAFARTPTPILFSTHTDVFPRRRDFLAWMLGQCDSSTPVVGWQMSPRQDPLWRQYVSHTATAWHMPTMRKHGISWGFDYWYQVKGLPARPTVGWPDTECCPNLRMQEAGIVPKLIGGETNYERTVNEWYDHARTITGMRSMGHQGRLRQHIEGYTAAALADAKARLAQWKGEAHAGLQA